MNQQEFINLIKDGAIKAQKDYGICASMTMAQAILESGWGKYAPGNNLFGIKWQDGCGYDRQLLNTREVFNGQETYIDDYFRKYDSMSDSIYDHAQFIINNSRYSNLLGTTDYIEACRFIQEDGYATAPDYAFLLIQLIEENNLNQFDNIEGEFDMKNLIIFSGDGDLPGAQLLAYKLNTAMISRAAYITNPIKAENIYVVGGTWVPDNTDSTLLSGNGRVETTDAVVSFIKSL